jgi:1-acyl-sn-glycerol-3-phosphate acyltransferase
MDAHSTATPHADPRADADGRPAARLSTAGAEDLHASGPATHPGPATPGPATPPPATHPEVADLSAFHEHALARGVNPVLYRLARVVLVPIFLLYFRLEGIGREHIPSSGPVLFAANHRSFLDPFVIGALTRRPVYYMAKRELFERRWQAWLLNGLGAFPVDRGRGDEHAMSTARAVLERGDCVVIFPEGTRVRPGPLGAPHRGVGRLALQTGARVIPVAVMGTEDVRRGWRIRPRKVTLRYGRPLGFPIVEHPSPSIALGVAERIWACVSLQWEWLGGIGAERCERPPSDTPRRQARAA